MLDVLAPDRAGAIVLAGGTTVIVARAAGTGTTAHAMAVGVGVTGIVDGTAPMTEAAVARAGGTTTATHAMSVVTALCVAARVLAHGIVSDTIVGWPARSFMGDKVRRETAVEVTTLS